MAFTLPKYRQPHFDEPMFANAPNVRYALAEMDGVVPDNYHATSIFPEYFKLDGQWTLAEESRMDCCVVWRQDGSLCVLELRNVKKGDRILLGRTENAEDGIFMHTHSFEDGSDDKDAFAFRSGRSRETAFSVDYDNLYELLLHERDHGNILWVAGPAFAFDSDSRNAMQQLIQNGFVHGLLAGNALATHDLEAAYFRTALGQDIYTQKSAHNGHYHHLDLLNLVRRSGSIPNFIKENNIQDGIVYSLVRQNVPYVLTSSIRDDGPLPEVIADAYLGQNSMRNLVRKATTVICLATQLHTIATGNMTPSFRMLNGEIRPLYIYSVDISEFVVNKLRDRGTLSAISMVTNVQDFVVHVARGVMK